MNPPPRLAPALEERLSGLPAVPAERYLAAGRSAVRRRRAWRAGAAGVLVAAVVTTVFVLPGSGPQRGVEHPPAVAAAPATSTTSLSSLPVVDGVGDIDAFSTDDVPGWASEYGEHGPAAIAPDGRLWIAPEASVVRTIADPMRGTDAITGSYAVEAEFEGELQWSFVFREPGITGTFGTVDDPGRWTVDFALWTENEVARFTSTTPVAERLAHFADPGAAKLTAGPGATIVRQVEGIALPGRPLRARRVAAQLLVQGQTWFVLGVGKRDTVDYYEAYDAPSVGASDLDGFVAFLDDQGGDE